MARNETMRSANHVRYAPQQANLACMSTGVPLPGADLPSSTSLAYIQGFVACGRRPVTRLMLLLRGSRPSKSPPASDHGVKQRWARTKQESRIVTYPFALRLAITRERDANQAIHPRAWKLP